MKCSNFEYGTVSGHCSVTSPFTTSMVFFKVLHYEELIFLKGSLQIILKYFSIVVVCTTLLDFFHIARRCEFESYYEKNY